MGAYEILRTGKKIKLTIIASGSEVNLAIETSHNLAKQKNLFKSSFYALPGNF